MLFVAFLSEIIVIIIYYFLTIVFFIIISLLLSSRVQGPAASGASAGVLFALNATELSAKGHTSGVISNASASTVAAFVGSLVYIAIHTPVCCLFGGYIFIHARLCAFFFIPFFYSFFLFLFLCLFYAFLIPFFLLFFLFFFFCVKLY